MRKTLATLLGMILTGTASGTTQSHAAQSPDQFFLLTAILAPFIASIAIGFFYRYLGDRSAYIGGFSAIVSFLSIVYLLGTSGTVNYTWIPSLGISAEFLVDGLGLMIGLLASGIGALVFLYSRTYMAHEGRKRKYYSVLTAFMGSMIGLVFSSNLILLFMFWEFTSVCSFLLISHHQRTDSGIYASRKSLMLTVGSGLLLLTGFLILGSATGTFSIADLLSMHNVAETLAESQLYIPVLLTIGIGAAAKSAQIPLHIWLPDAMEAPTPVSAFLHSATMVKAGVFLIGRFRPVLMQGETWNLFFITLGLMTMTGAALMAVGADELKELLAYSTASHLGLIVAGFGFVGNLGAETSVFHILNHAVFKASLFMVAGVILHEAGTHRISELSGLRKKWPVLAGIATVSGLSMAGIPPLNGFYSKELLFESVYHFASQAGGAAWLLPGVAVLGSVFTFIYSLRFISVFYGDIRGDTHSVPTRMIIPPGILALTAVVIGLAPNQFIDLLVEPALGSVALEAHEMSVHLPKGLKPASVMSLITVGTGAAVFRKTDLIHDKVRETANIRFLQSNYYYHTFLHLIDHVSDYTVNLTETSLLRTYAVWVLGSTSVIGLAGYIVSAGLPQVSVSASTPVMIVLATSFASVYAVIRSDTYISSVLTLSILGFMVSIYYLLMDAPDLTMTQLVVETLSLTIFLLVLDQLPEFRKKVSGSRKERDGIIAGLTGLTVFTSVLYSTAEKTPGKISDYYFNHALPGSGGSNVVNVILVDFRGLDTLGEISVIAMAGLSVFMLFRMRGET